MWGRCSRVRSGSGVRRWSVEAEDTEQRGVDAPLFFRCETAGEVAESLKVNGSHLLDEHASQGAVDVDLGSEGRWFGAGRCGCHQHYRSWEEGVGLDDDAETTPSLFVSQPLGESQGEDVTPVHGDSP